MTITNPALETITVPLPADDWPVGEDRIAEDRPVPKESDWYPIANYPNIKDDEYEINVKGKVKSIRSGKVLKPSVQGVHLWLGLRNNEGGNTSARVDKLVLATFDRWEPLMTPEHIDGDATNCRADNLRWREPTATEIGALRAQEERRQGTRATKTGPARKKAKVVGAPAKTPKRGKPVVPTIQVTRKYSFEDVVVELAEDGALLSVYPDPNRVPYTAHQTMLLCQLMGRIQEMNLVMGVH